MPNALLKWISLAAWYTLNATAALFLLRYAFPVAIKDGGVTYPGIDHIYQVMAQRTPIAVPSSLIVAAMAMLGGLSVLFWVAGRLMREVADRLGMLSLYHDAATSVIWSFRQAMVPCVAAMIVSLLFLGVLMAVDGVGLYPALALVGAQWFCVIGLIGNRRLLRNRSGRRGWCLEWPGWQPLSIFALALLLLDRLDQSVWSAVSLAGWWAAPVELVWQGLYWLAFGVALSAVVYRIPWRALSGEFRERARLRFIAAWLVINFRLFVLGLWLLPPIVVGAVTYAFVLPEYRYTEATAVAGPRSAISGVVWLAQTAASDWFLFVPPFVILLMLAYARFLTLYDKRRGLHGHPP